jgi:hypothetical protein
MVAGCAPGYPDEKCRERTREGQMPVMHPPTLEIGPVVRAYQRAAKETTDLLMSLDGTSDLIPGSEWTVREAAVHLICWARYYRRFLAGSPSPARRPDDFDVINAAYFVALDESDPQVLASLLRDATSAYAHDLSTCDAGQPCPWHFGLTIDATTWAAGAAGELLMHGWDIASTSGKQFSDDDAAVPTLIGTSVMWPTFTAPRGDKPAGTLAVSVDGQVEFAYFWGRGAHLGNRRSQARSTTP